ncbi:MAG: 4-phosphoerythronate dehydrogenase, partial [Gammaproteobacteria bacterium]|nr:4-phosphoerythronate dehydrogenase [Gammaproteobacteria bacterium]
MKIIADQQIPNVAKAFSGCADVTLCHGRDITAERIEDANVLLVRSITAVNAKLLEGSQVKYVATATSGIDHIDLEYLQQNNIGFTHAKGSNARSVAEYILSSLFVLADQHDFNFKDKTVGVIGCGEVGSRVVDMLETIGVSCMMNDPPLKDAVGKDAPGNDQSIAERYCDLQELLSADIITLHVPLTEDGPYPTQKLVDADFLAKLNDDVILINTARGGVIDELALKKHLDNHRKMKVVLDVWEGEPDIDIDLLSRVEIGTHHIAGYSTDAKFKASEMVFHAICDFYKLDLAWQSKIKIPDTSLPELGLSSDMSEEDAIQMAVLESYDVRGDAATLRCLPEITIEQRGRYFDELR